MKKSNANKPAKKTNHNHNVETPAPPQVMNPSVTPEEDAKQGGKDKGKKQSPGTKKKPTQGEELAPAEEL
jgi:hypothetical protein